ncbi:MAG: hypothetical protein KC561_19955, partial [Myxococcales bacterium]|nr:hypothetical protein [Myxococcales bacterium]
WGPLPLSSDLRVKLNVTHDKNVLVAPVELRSKTILMLYLDNGESEFTSPGRSLERLLVDISKALERVILMRKRGRRKKKS